MTRLAFPGTLSFLIVFAFSFAFPLKLSLALVVSFTLALRALFVNEIYVHRVIFSLLETLACFQVLIDCLAHLEES